MRQLFFVILVLCPVVVLPAVEHADVSHIAQSNVKRKLGSITSISIKQLSRQPRIIIMMIVLIILTLILGRFLMVWVHVEIRISIPNHFIKKWYPSTTCTYLLFIWTISSLCQLRLQLLLRRGTLEHASFLDGVVVTWRKSIIPTMYFGLTTQHSLGLF